MYAAVAHCANTFYFHVYYWGDPHFLGVGFYCFFPHLPPPAPPPSLFPPSSTTHKRFLLWVQILKKNKTPKLCPPPHLPSDLQLSFLILLTVSFKGQNRRFQFEWNFYPLGKFSSSRGSVAVNFGSKTMTHLELPSMCGVEWKLRFIVVSPRNQWF